MDDLQIVRIFNNRIDAEIALNILESNDIKCMISGDDIGGMRPDFLMAMGGAKLLVLQQDLEKAKEILDAHFTENE